VAILAARRYTRAHILPRVTPHVCYRLPYVYKKKTCVYFLVPVVPHFQFWPAFQFLKAAHMTSPTFCGVQRSPTLGQVNAPLQSNPLAHPNLSRVCKSSPASRPGFESCFAARPWGSGGGEPSHTQELLSASWR